MSEKMREDHVHGADKVCGLLKAQQLSASRQHLLLPGFSDLSRTPAHVLDAKGKPNTSCACRRQTMSCRCERMQA